MSLNRTGEPESDATPVIQLRVPGPWATLASFLDALEDAKLGYDYDDGWLVHRPSGRRIELNVTPHDDEIAALFEHPPRLSPEEIERIASHAVKVHLSVPVKSLDDTRAIVDAAAALVRAGGFGVFIDNSGATHGVDDWLALADDPKPGGLYWAFVVLTQADGRLFSAGMHCLGLRDAEMPAPSDPEYGWYFMHNFLGYTYQSGTEMNDGDPIGDETAATHHVKHVPCTRYPQGTAFFNPLGVWELVPVNDE